MPNPIQLISDPISMLVFAMYGSLMIWEALFPARKLPQVKHWRLKGISFFALFFFLSSYLPMLLDPVLEPYRLIDLSGVPVWLGALAGLLLYELGVFLWHYAMHRSDLLWRTFHQMHHSAERLDTYGAFFLEPAGHDRLHGPGERLFYPGYGTAPEGHYRHPALHHLHEHVPARQHPYAKVAGISGATARKPYPASRTGKHRNNYSDLPLIDMLFGTFRNPRGYRHETGFYDGASSRLLDMLRFREISGGRSAGSRRKESPPMIRPT